MLKQKSDFGRTRHWHEHETKIQRRNHPLLLVAAIAYFEALSFEIFCLIVLFFMQNIV